MNQEAGRRSPPPRLAYCQEKRDAHAYYEDERKEGGIDGAVGQTSASIQATPNTQQQQSHRLSKTSISSLSSLEGPAATADMPGLSNWNDVVVHFSRTPFLSLSLSLDNLMRSRSAALSRDPDTGRRRPAAEREPTLLPASSVRDK